jgi:hypothetical protein
LQPMTSTTPQTFIFSVAENQQSSNMSQRLHKHDLC